MSGRQFVKGNEAVAMAAIEAGVRCYFGYPITPRVTFRSTLPANFPGQAARLSRRRAKSVPSIWCSVRQLPVCGP